MDEMKINSAFARGIIEKIINKEIEKKLGHRANVAFQGPISITLDDKALVANLNVSISVHKDELSDILKEVL